MFDSVLIGVDGRRGGRDAIALAKRLAAPNASFTLAHVDARGPVSWWSHHVGEERVFDRSAAMLAAERDRAGIRAAIVCVADAAPGRALHDLAEQRAADLIVIGSSRRAPRGRVMLGDDAVASLHGAPCAIAIAPGGSADRAARLVEIGVACDGSPEGELALATARELASRTGASIRALWMVSPRDVGEEEPIPADRPLAALRLVGARSDRLAELDGIAGEAVYGARSRELSLFSSRVDLLIVGAGAHGSLRRTARGSVLRHLGRCSTCPLLVVAPAVAGIGSAVRAA